MRGEINSDKFALFVQPFYRTPFLCLWDWWMRDFYRFFASKQRGSCLVLLLLEELTIANKCVEEDFALAIDAKELLTAKSEAVETTT